MKYSWQVLFDAPFCMDCRDHYRIDCFVCCKVDVCTICRVKKLCYQARKDQVVEYEA